MEQRQNKSPFELEVLKDVGDPLYVGDEEGAGRRLRTTW